MKARKLRWRILWDYLTITLGTAIMAVAINGFYAPNRISDGGVSGIGIILQYTFAVPLWVTLTVANLPLLWLSHRLWGGRVGTRTIYGTLMLSVMVGVLQIHPATHVLLLATVYGGIISGVGLGLVFRSSGTTGGTDVIARFIGHLLPVSMGQAMLAIDFVIIAAFGVVFSPTTAMYSLMALFISSRTIDLVQEGIAYARAFTIVSHHGLELADQIMQEIGRGVTRVQAFGHYTGEERPVLYVVVTRSEVTRLKSLVYRVDPTAFVVVANVHEVVGEGFRNPPVES